MSEETKIAVVVAPEGRERWRVYPEGHPKTQFVVASEMPDGRSFAPGTRVILRVVIPNQRHAIIGIAPPAGSSVVVPVTVAKRNDK
jgi:hypothetical protein